MVLLVQIPKRHPLPLATSVHVCGGAPDIRDRRCVSAARGRVVIVEGVDVPAPGFGTWPMEGETCRTALRTALEHGYRHIDTAQMYENEGAVGEAIAESEVPREDVFLVTKLLSENLAHDDVLRTAKASRDRLDTDYIDLLLIHSPSRSVPIEESIGATNRLQAEGVVDHIGVSNFSVPQLEAAIDASETPILTNQVEYHPFTSKGDLLEFCLDHGIMLTAYAPVARGRVVGNETLEEIGERYGKTAAQVALRWLVQQEMVAAIPKASTPEHMRENIDIFDFDLTAEGMEQIFDLRGGLVQRLRTLLGLETAPQIIRRSARHYTFDTSVAVSRNLIAISSEYC